MGPGSPGGRKRVDENGPAFLVPRRGPKAGTGGVLGQPRTGEQPVSLPASAPSALSLRS